MTPIPRFVLAVVVAATVLLGPSGCAHPSASDSARVGPFFTPANHSGEPSLGDIKRVVVLPVWVGEGTPPESAAELDAVFVAALQNQKRFEVVSFSRKECQRRYRSEALSSASALPANLFETLQREFAADAVLFVDLTTFNPYPPLTLGLRGKLAAIADARLVWTFDNLFSAETPVASNSARHFFLDRDKSIPADLTRAALQSPSKFAAYAAASMFATLPPAGTAPRAIAK